MSANQKFAAKVETRLGKVTVYKAEDREAPLWEVLLPDYGIFFSSVHVSDAGDYLIHLRGNHTVRNLQDTGLHCITNDRYICAMPAGHFIDAFVKTVNPTSVDARQKWVERVEMLTDECFTVINAKGEKKVVKLVNLKLEKL